MAAGFLVIVAQWSEHWQLQCSIVTLFSFHLEMFGSNAWIDDYVFANRAIDNVYMLFHLQLLGL